MKKIIYSAVAACTLTVTCYAQDAVIDKSTLTPVEAVQIWGSDMENGKVTSLWDALPKAYQADAQGLVRALGKQMDAGIYNEAIKTLTMVNDLLKAKELIILEMMEAEVPADNAKELAKFKDLKGSYSDATDFLDALLKSDIKNVEGLKTFDMAKFCQTIEPNLKSLVTTVQALNEKCNLGDMKVKLLSKGDNKAEVEVTTQEKTEKVSLARVANRWLPSEMTAEWDEKIKEAKQGIGMMEKMDAKQKQQVAFMMQLAQMTIKELDKAQTAEDLKKAMEAQMEKFAPMLMGAGAL